MLLKCPFCGASVEHDPQADVSPVCPGCKLKLTPPGPPPLPHAPEAPPVPPAAGVQNSGPPDLPEPPPVAAPSQVATPSHVGALKDLAAPPMLPTVPVVPIAESAAEQREIPDSLLAEEEVSDEADSPLSPPRTEPANAEPPTIGSEETGDPEETPIGQASAGNVAATPFDDSGERAVLIPSADGSFVPVDDRITHITHRGAKVELLNVTHDQRQTARRIRSTIIFLGCIIVLAGFMIWLSNYL